MMWLLGEVDATVHNDTLEGDGGNLDVPGSAGESLECLSAAPEHADDTDGATANDKCGQNKHDHDLIPRYDQADG